MMNKTASPITRAWQHEGLSNRQPLFVLVILLALCGVFSTSALAQDETSILLQAERSSFQPGEIVQVSLGIMDVRQLYGFEAQIRFDPAVVQVVDMDPNQAGVQVKAGSMFNPANGFLVTNSADNALGTISYVFTLLAPAQPMAGNGNLLQFNLQAVAEGWAGLAVAQLILATDQGTAISYNLEVIPLAVGDAAALPSPTQSNPTIEPSITNAPSITPDLPTATPAPPTATFAVSSPAASETNTPLPRDSSATSDNPTDGMTSATATPMDNPTETQTALPQSPAQANEPTSAGSAPSATLTEPLSTTPPQKGENYSTTMVILVVLIILGIIGTTGLVVVLLRQRK